MAGVRMRADISVRSLSEPAIREYPEGNLSEEDLSMAVGTVPHGIFRPRRGSGYSSRSTHRNTSGSPVHPTISVTKTLFTAGTLRRARPTRRNHHRWPAAIALFLFRSFAFRALCPSGLSRDDQGRPARPAHRSAYGSACKTRRCLGAAVCVLLIACITHIGFSSHVTSAAVCIVLPLLTVAGFFGRPVSC